MNTASVTPTRSTVPQHTVAGTHPGRRLVVLVLRCVAVVPVSGKQIRRSIASLALTLIAVAALPAVSASAAVTTPSGGSAQAYFTCDDRNNQLSYGVTIYPDYRRASQNVAFRIYSQDVSTGSGSWSTWRSGITGPYAGQPYGYDNIVRLPESLSRFYVEYGWRTSAGWKYAGEWITRYIQLGWYNGVYNGTFRYCDV